ncbi:hypothetical protein OIO90_001322 [Microbotryomycetes sp. JL221]|nr:hypothetical protein OIO90_001322 [Microbotryomycetes sp. JL221]
MSSSNSRALSSIAVDLICPFSQKQLQGVYDSVLPLIRDGSLDLKVVIRQVPQPWHSSSTLVHEAAIAVAQVLAEDKGNDFNDPGVNKQFNEFFKELMDNTESAVQTRERLADIAQAYVDRNKFLDKVKTGKSNGGTAVTTDLKQAIKYGRQMGIHVTPTVTLDGLVEPSISSSFSKDDWSKFFEDKQLLKGRK